LGKWFVTLKLQCWWCYCCNGCCWIIVVVEKNVSHCYMAIMYP